MVTVLVTLKAAVVLDVEAVTLDVVAASVVEVSDAASVLLATPAPAVDVSVEVACSKLSVVVVVAQWHGQICPFDPCEQSSSGHHDCGSTHAANVVDSVDVTVTVVAQAHGHSCALVPCEQSSI